MRRKSRVKEDVEYYSNVRAITAIEQVDIVLIVIDATTDIQSRTKK